MSNDSQPNADEVAISFNRKALAAHAKGDLVATCRIVIDAFESMVKILAQTEIETHEAGRQMSGFPSIEIHVGVVNHKHGSNAYVGLTKEAVEAKIAGFCSNYACEVGFDDEKVAGYSDKDLIEAYFLLHPHDTYDIGSDALRLDPADLAQLAEALAKSAEPAMRPQMLR